MFENFYSDRIKKVPPSFIRESLKVIQDKDIISFAGGLPNPISFPQEELKLSLKRITEKYKDKLYQYSTTLGLDSLRQYIVNRYNSIWNMNINIDNIIITTGSQQALDLIAKVFLNSNDKVLTEEPSYLGLIQTFSMYNAVFVTTKLNEEGLDIDNLEKNINMHNPKLAYLIPNFQNPTGITYTKGNREKVFDIIKDKEMILIQDDPYGELGFDFDKRIDYIGLNKTNKNIYLGSFSKIITPGMRLGYIIADKEIIRMLETAKQTADLHSNIFAQYLISDYLYNNNLDEHILKIKKLYKQQAECMINSMKEFFPSDIKYTIPKGGMFTWVTLKEDMSAIDLFYKAVKRKVAFIPGRPFYVNKTDTNTLRLNYTNSSQDMIVEGIKRLTKAMKD